VSEPGWGTGGRGEGQGWQREKNTDSLGRRVENRKLWGAVTLRDWKEKSHHVLGRTASGYEKKEGPLWEGCVQHKKIEASIRGGVKRVNSVAEVNLQPVVTRVLRYWGGGGS